MAFRFLHVTIGYSSLMSDPKFLEPVVAEMSKDWLRYHSNCWLLWTDRSVLTVVEMIRGRLLKEDHILVSRADLSEAPGGLLPPWCWQWINTPRDPATGEPKQLPDYSRLMTALLNRAGDKGTS